jgi:protein TonB
MVQSHALRTQRFQFGKLDLTRICGETGAFAINGAALLLLLAPLNMPVAPPAQPQVTYDYMPVKPRDNPKPPEPPKQVEVVRRTSPAPTLLPQRIEVPQPPVFEHAQEGDTQAPPEQVAKADPGLGNSITEPLAGARLEYETAPAPRYPIEALRQSLSGTVTLRVLVDVDGRPIDVQVAQSSGHRILDAVARKQVLAKWRFKAAMQDGRAVQAIGLVPVVFDLDG